MLRLLDNFLLGFRPYFSHYVAFHWFVIFIIGFIIRFDHTGVTSFIRWLYLDPTHYDSMLLFLKTSSWQISALLAYWAKMAIGLFPLFEVNDRPVLIGDGIKVCKEAKTMPGVKRLHQDSDNSGKADTIWGDENHLQTESKISAQFCSCNLEMPRNSFLCE